MGLDLLNIATSGVVASQAQLAVTGNNIANANTEGYHRQVATQGTYESQKIGDSYFGAGAYVADVKRVYNQYAAKELRIGQSNLSEAEMSLTKLNDLDELYSKVGKVVPQSLTDFYESLNNLAGLPDDIAIRNSTLVTAEQVAGSLNQMQSRLDDKLQQTNEQIATITDRISEISNELGALNLEIVKSEGNDLQLLDKQDALIQELSQYSQVNTIPIGNGAKSIMLGGSVMLVSGEVSMSMGTKPGDPSPNKPTLTTTINNTVQDVNGALMGGELGALFKYRDGELSKAINELGQLALGVADSFNEMQSQGFDLNGQMGQNLFTDINDPNVSSTRVGTFSTNTGTAALSVEIDDVTQLTGSSYELKFATGTPDTYTLIDDLTGKETALTLNGAGTQLLGGDGFIINIDSGAFADRDRFEISPTSGAAAGISLAFSDPELLATASPKVTADAANSGSMAVKLTSIDDRNAVNFPLTDSELTFDIDMLAGTYDVFDVNGTAISTGTAITPGTPPTISAHGFTFELNTTTATASERFTFDLSHAKGDNTNTVAMATMSESKHMENGDATLVDLFEETKLSIGGSSKSAQVRSASAEIIYSQAYERQQSVSGVNLDEEAAKLMRYQQSYQASARIMTTATQIFETLFSSTR
ncbi:flagellar hook-associated protein FlgK [Shewanella gelidii]|uniref:Flagellar hook-associated protein 1 n=1 Tax=Shewanella gelidii TaxID=1642821 RepID=A0A917JKJ6_9GAMM|nr:flagellar hook-associated protein FlgK [Shewanella gelidii]MCL1096477.1 flagellar hook-associated protein FlgK [Shewanella gelidii]GGI67632.1 flagellar hook-associated protein FlgK [Shewanella gelidii]